MTKIVWRLQEPPPSPQMMDSMERMIQNHKQRELEQKGKKESKEDDLPEDLDTYEQLLSKRIEELREQKTKLFLLMKEVLKHDDEKKKRQMQKEMEQRQKMHHHQHHTASAKPSLIPPPTKDQPAQQVAQKPPPPPLQIAERTLSAGSTPRLSSERPSPIPTPTRDQSPKKRARSPEIERTDVSRRRYDDKPLPPTSVPTVVPPLQLPTTPIRSIQAPLLSTPSPAPPPSRSQNVASYPHQKQEPAPSTAPPSTSAYSTPLAANPASAPLPPPISISSAQPSRPATSTQYYPQYVPPPPSSSSTTATTAAATTTATTSVPQVTQQSYNHYTVFQYGQGQSIPAVGVSEPIKITASSYSTSIPSRTTAEPIPPAPTLNQNPSLPREEPRGGEVKKWKPLSELSQAEPDKAEPKVKSVFDLLVPPASNAAPEHASLLEDAVENLTPEGSPLPDASNLPKLPVPAGALYDHLSTLSRQPLRSNNLSSVSPISPTHSPPRRSQGGKTGPGSSSSPRSVTVSPPHVHLKPTSVQSQDASQPPKSEPSTTEKTEDKTGGTAGQEPSLQQRQYQQYQQYQQYSQLNYQQYPQQYQQYQVNYQQYPYGYQQFNFQQYPGFTTTFQQYGTSPAKGATQPAKDPSTKDSKT